MVTEQPQPEQEPPILTALNDRAHPKEQMTASTRPLMRRATREEKIDRPGVYWVPVEQPEQKRPQNCGTSYCSCIECVMEQPEQEPVALETVYETIIQWDEGGGKRSRRELARRIVALYTTPPRREWVGLTDEDVNGVKHTFDWASPWTFADFARAIEAKLKAKNDY